MPMHNILWTNTGGDALCLVWYHSPSWHPTSAVDSEVYFSSRLCICRVIFVTDSVELVTKTSAGFKIDFDVDADFCDIATRLTKATAFRQVGVLIVCVFPQADAVAIGIVMESVDTLTWKHTGSEDQETVIDGVPANIMSRSLMKLKMFSARI